MHEEIDLGHEDCVTCAYWCGYGEGYNNGFSDGEDYGYENGLYEGSQTPSAGFDVGYGIQ
jgi:hypothetical protein